MSLQSELDAAINQDKNYNITISGESGSLNLPKHVNVNLFDCQISSLTATGGDNAIFITRSTVSGVMDHHDGSLIAENSKFMGEVFWRRGNRVWVRDSLFNFRVSAETNSNADLSACEWAGSGSWAIRALSKSHVTVSNGNVKQRDKGVWAEDGSYIDVIGGKISTNIGTLAENNSQVKLLGVAENSSQIAFKLKDKSQIYVSQMNGSIKTPDYHVEAEDNCRFHSEGTDYEGANISVKASKNCTIEIVNFAFVKSTGGNCIDLTDKCEALFISGSSIIESSGAKAIYATDNSKVRCINVNEIKGIGDDAVHMDNNSKFTAMKCPTIKSEALAALRGTLGSSISVNRSDLVQGEGDAGCILSDNSRGWFANTGMLKSVGANAVDLTTESDVSFQDHGTILSDAGHGISADGSATVQIQTLQTCQGELSGIIATNNSNVDIIYAEMIQGKSQYGVSGETNCDIRVNRSTSVKGELGGIVNTTNGSLDIELVKEISGVASASAGVTAENKIDVRMVLVESVKKGAKFTDCISSLKDCSITNDQGAGITVQGGEIDMKGLTAEGQGTSISLNNAYAKANTTTMNQSISSSQSVIELAGVTLNGDITSDNDSITIYRGTISGGIDASNSTINIEVGTLQNITLNGGTLDIEKTSSGNVSLTNSVIKSRLSSGSQLSLTSSSGDVHGGSFSSVTVDGSSSLQIAKCSGSISGSGNVIAMDAGSVGTGMNSISMSNQIVKIMNKSNTKIEQNSANIEIDAQAGGGNVTIKSTVATAIE